MTTGILSLPRILIVDDDRELTAMLSEYLGHEGFVVTVEHDGAEAVQKISAQNADLVILDVMLPGKSGLDVLRAVRARDERPPVLMLTARGDDVDRIVGLELGADDYLAKPFNPRELVARMRAVLRRGAERGATGEPLSLGPVRLDSGRHRVTVHGNPVPLTGAEFRVLECLMRSAGRVLSREQLLDLAKGSAELSFDRSIDVHVSRLRAKLGDDSRSPKLLKTVRGAGYMLAGGDP